MLRRALRIALPAALLLALLAGVAAMVRSIAAETRTPVDLGAVDYATSESCEMCHPQRYASWYRTYHRTMTQPADPGAVLGDFGGATLTHDGVTSRFTRDGDRFFIETLNAYGAMERHEVALTVGSRRIQQYVTRVGDRHVRLPLAWNIEERRWMHLNGAFLDPDGAAFNTHRALWDVNCIFCHNTKAQPRYDVATGTFDAKVAELGIACEACHGPAAVHVARNRDPLRRYLLHLGGRDPTIHSPAEMTPERQVEVCGHCHGQRTPNPPSRLAEFLTTGDPYTAGDDLGAVTRPLDAHTAVPGIDVALRFWKDGTPRLTAYEYQGLLLSKGHETSDLTCISCHDMHGGDPRGMIQPAMRGNQGCLQCHGDIGRDLRAHTGHDPAGAGSDCYSCHMPPTTWGLLAIHPSHRITNPEPARAWRHDMPDACTVCHTDRTAAWAAREVSRHYGSPLPADLPVRGGFEHAETVRALLAGDVVQRAVAAHALAAERSSTREVAARLWAIPLLIVTLEDRYPAIRRVARRGLERLAALAERDHPGLAARPPGFDPMAPAPDRAAAIERWWAWWRAVDRSRLRHPGAAVPLDSLLMPVRPAIAALVARQDQTPIAIGE